MNRWTGIALHAVAAAAFFMLFQRFLLNASLNETLLWGFGAGGIAAIIAFNQTRAR